MAEADRRDRFHEGPAPKGSAQGRGSSVELRSAFERDRDRLLYSTAFRRLGGVTQVVRPIEGHAFHNRLTHSIKVAQLARRLTSYLHIAHPGQAIMVDPDVVETAAIAHDLGHPPFGHAAEKQLDACIEETCGGRDGFEGNAQSFRIVTKVAKKSTQHAGLDLTRASLNAILKYPWPRKERGKDEKWGFYETEREEFEYARALTPGRGETCPEAEIMDWADDVTYAVHDVDDFYRAGLIPLNQVLLHDTPEQKAFLRADLVKRHLEKSGKSAKDAVGVFDDYTTPLQGQSALFPEILHQPYDGSPQQRAALREFASELIKRFMRVRLEPHLLEPVVELTEDGLGIDSEAVFEVGLLKCLARFYVFESPGLVAQQTGHREIVRVLFETLFESAKKGAWNHNLLPQPFIHDVRRLERERSSSRQRPHERARIVADYIASLSDEQAIALFQAVTGSRPSSPLRPII